MKEMTFLEHLGELRGRIIASLSAILVVSAVVYALGIPDFVVEKIGGDVFGHLPLFAFSFSEAIMMKLKLSIVLGAIVCLPFLFYEFWAFMNPGFRENERRIAALLLFFSLLFFLAGALFAYVFVLPPLIGFLLAQAEGIAQSRIQLTRSLEFVGAVLLLGGLTFQLPMIMAILARQSVCDWRFYVRNARYILIGVLITQIILTDISVLLQMIFAFLVMVAYGLGVFVSFLVKR